MLAPRNPAAGAARKRIALGALVAACLAFSAPDAGASSRRALAGPVAFAGRVTGLVRDKATGEELIGATVQVKGTAIGIATDVDGRFSLPSVPSGAQTLVVSYIGYRQQEVAVNVVDGGTVQVTVDLEPSSLQGDEVTVTAQVEGQVAAINQQIASNTISNVVSAARIQELPDVNAAESIGRVPGVSIQRSGGEGVPDPAWWTGVLLPALTADSLTRRVSSVLVWRNAVDRAGHFYAPPAGHPAAADFVRFREDPLILFEDELPNLYAFPRR